MPAGTALICLSGSSVAGCSTVAIKWKVSLAAKKAHLSRVRTYRDTSSVEPGSEPIFGSVSGSENHNFGILCDKDTFCLY